MPSLLLFLLDLAVQMATQAALSAASSAGHDGGIAIVKKWLPLLSDDAALVVLHAAKKRIAAWGIGAHAIETAPIDLEALCLSLAIPLNPDGSIPIANPLIPPDPGPM